MKDFDDLSLRVLRLFDEWQKELLDLHELFESGDSNDPETRTAVFYRVERLVEEGLLVERGNDFYSRTVEGQRVARDGRIEDATAQN